MILLESKISSFTLLKISCTVICSKFNSMGVQPLPKRPQTGSSHSDHGPSWYTLPTKDELTLEKIQQPQPPTSKAWWLQESLLLTLQKSSKLQAAPKGGGKKTPQNSWVNSWVLNCQHELLGRWISLHQRYGVISFWVVRAKQKCCEFWRSPIIIVFISLNRKFKEILRFRCRFDGKKCSFAATYCSMEKAGLNCFTHFIGPRVRYIQRQTVWNPWCRHLERNPRFQCRENNHTMCKLP